jgi:anti-sigma factor RsiW
MTPEAGEVERDEELQKLLSRWSAPIVPEGMDERVLAAFRRQTGRAEPWWSRLFTASVRVPMPVAVGLLMLFVVTAVLALRPVAPQPTAGTAGPAEPVQAARAAAPPVVTRTSLAGFQPVSEVTATVVETQEIRQ